MSRCESCANFNIYRMVVRNSRLTSTCKAYPNGIPKDIFSGKIKHNKPIKGDSGIQFEKYNGLRY